MKQNVIFYRCPICGNVIGLIEGNIKHMTCCGKPMEALIANTVDAATEKHIPVYEKTDNEIVVRVGEVDHPMEQEHYINWIAQVSENSTTRVRLNPGQPAEARFDYIPNSTLYAYCNKHGLWKAEVK